MVHESVPCLVGAGSRSLADCWSSYLRGSEVGGELQLLPWRRRIRSLGRVYQAEVQADSWTRL